jgi:peptidoglycan/xylan/chitin deacetylase (PgdA/CDA1 family)
MYHSVNPQATFKNRLTVSALTFERQMGFFKRHHYNVLPLEELAVFIKEKKRIPPNAVVITFDDGYKDNYIYAFPILKKYNFPATIFIIVNEVGRAQNDRLSWDEIKEMQKSGIITIGSHCLDHKTLTDIKSEEELKRQIFVSKEILEEKLKEKVNTFCYIRGSFNPRVRQTVIDAGYKAGVATSPGKKYPNDDILVLKRLRISENAKNLFVFWFETTGFYNFIREHRHK